MRILVTRPQPAADRLARRLTAAGHRAVALPVIETVAVAARRPPGSPDALLFVSSAAVHHGWPLVGPAAQGRIVLAVGSATAGALAARGVTPEVPADERSEGLLALCGKWAADWQRVWIVRGRGGRECLQTGLAQLGVAVEVVEVYERRPWRRPPCPDGHRKRSSRRTNGERQRIH